MIIQKDEYYYYNNGRSIRLKNIKYDPGLNRIIGTTDYGCLYIFDDSENEKTLFASGNLIPIHTEIVTKGPIERLCSNCIYYEEGFCNSTKNSICHVYENI
jgi:hypothetical protein